MSDPKPSPKTGWGDPADTDAAPETADSSKPIDKTDSAEASKETSHDEKKTDHSAKESMGEVKTIGDDVVDISDSAHAEVKSTPASSTLDLPPLPKRPLPSTSTAPPESTPSTSFRTEPPKHRPVPKSSIDLVHDKQVSELERINRMNRGIIEEKEQEIRQLRQAQYAGRVQKKLHAMTQQVHQLVKENESLQQQLSEQGTVHETRAQGEEEIKSLQSKLYQTQLLFDEEIQKMQGQIDALKKENAELDRQLDAKERNEAEHLRQISELSRQKATMKQQLDSLRGEVRGIKDGSTFDDLETRLYKLERERNDLRADNEELLTTLQGVTKENEGLRAERTHYEEIVTEKIKGASKTARQELEASRAEVKRLRNQLDYSEKKIQAMEQNSEQKQREIIELQEQMDEVLHGYGLPNAMKQIRQMREQFVKQEKENNELRDQLNDQQRVVHRLSMDNSKLKELAGVDESWGSSANDVSTEHDNRVRVLESTIAGLKKQVEHMNNERIALMNEVIKATAMRDEHGIKFLGLSPHETELVFEYAEKLRNGDSSLPVDNYSMELKTEITDLKAEIRVLKSDKAALQREVNSAAKSASGADSSDNPGIQDLKHTIADLRTQMQLRNIAPSRLDAQAQEEFRVTLTEAIGNMSQEERGKLFKDLTPSIRSALGPNDSLTYSEGGQDQSPVQSKLHDPATTSFADAPVVEEEDFADMKHLLEDKQGPARFVGCLKDLFQARKALTISNDALKYYRDQYEHIIERQHIMYAQFTDLERKHEQEKESMEKQIAEVRDMKKAEIADVEHKDVMLLRIDYNTLCRRYNAVKASYDVMLERDVQRRKDMMEMEQVLQKRIIFLSEAYEQATVRVQSLTETQMSMVPRHHVASLSAKYDLLSKQHSQLVTRLSEMSIKQNALQELNDKLSQTERQLIQARDLKDSLMVKCETMQKQIDDLSKALETDDDKHPKSDNPDDKKVSVPSLLARIASLEVSEEDAKRRLERFRSENTSMGIKVTDLESTLETKSADLAASKQTELELRQELTQLQSQVRDSIPYSKASRLQEAVSKLKEDNATLSSQLTQLKASANLASQAARQISQESNLGLEENQRLRELVIKLQEQSDDGNIIGKLEMDRIMARKAESQAKNELKDAQTKILRLEAALIQIQERLEHGNVEYFRAMGDYQAKLAARDKLITDLQQQGRTGLTIQQAETLHQHNARLSAQLETERKRAKSYEERLIELEDANAELKSKVASQQEFEHLVERDPSQQEMRKKLLDWHNEVQNMRLTKLRLENQVRQLESTVSFLRTTENDNEAFIGQLQEKIIMMENALEEKDLEMKGRFADLQAKERALEIKMRNLKHPNAVVMVGDGVKGDDGSGADLETYKKLEETIRQLKLKLKEADELQQDQEEIIATLQQREHLAKEQRDKEREQFQQAVVLRDAEKQRIMDMAQQNMAELEDTLRRKDEHLSEYKDMLDKVLEKCRASKEIDDQEIRKLTQQVLHSRDHHATKLQEAMMTLQELPAFEQAMHTDQVEEIIAKKDEEVVMVTKELEELRLQLDDLKQDYQKLQSENHDLRSELQAEGPQGQVKRMGSSTSRLKRETAQKTQRVKQLEQAIVQLKEDLLRVQANSFGGEPKKPSFLSQQDSDTSVDALTSVKVDEERQKWRRRVTSLQTEVDTLKKKYELLKFEHSTCQQKLAGDKRAIDTMKQLLNKKELQNKHIQAEADRARQSLNVLKFKHKAETAALRKKFSKMGGSTGGKVEGNVTYIPADQLPANVDVDQAKNDAAWSFGGGASAKDSKNAEKGEPMVAVRTLTAREKWEVQKKLELRITNLKRKLADKDKTVKSLQTQVSDIKKQLSTAVAESIDLRAALQGQPVTAVGSNRLRKRGSKLDNATKDSPATEAKQITIAEVKEIESLRSELFEAQREVISLKKEVEVHHEQKVLALEQENMRLSVLLEETRANNMDRDEMAEIPSISSLAAKLDEADRRIEELEAELLQRKCTNVELNFQIEHVAVEKEILNRRIDELSQLKNTLNAMSDSGSGSAKRAGARLLQKAGGGTGGSSREQELERAVETLNEVLRKLRSENESLKKSVHTNVKYMDLVHDNRRLKAEMKKLSEARGAERKSEQERQVEIHRLAEMNKQVTKSLKKETDTNARLRKKLHEERNKCEELAGQIQTQADLERARKAETLEVHRHKVCQNTIIKLEREVRAQAEQIDKYQAMAHELKADNDEKEAALQTMHQDMDHLTLHIEELKKHRPLTAKSQRDDSRPSSSSQEVHTLQQEVEQLRLENEALKQELSAFDLSFFDEVEDLKYRYHESLETLRQYESENLRLLEQVRQLQGRGTPSSAR